VRGVLLLWAFLFMFPDATLYDSIAQCCFRPQSLMKFVRESDTFRTRMSNRHDCSLTIKEDSRNFVIRLFKDMY